jgi:adenosylcobinamide-GDP ribazoletransferase
MDRERRLAVMRQPDVGTFGVMALTATTLVRVGALASIEPRPALLAGVVCASRTAMAVIARSLPYARTEGIVSAFLGGSAVLVSLVGLAISGPLLLVAAGLGGVALLAAVGVVAAGVALLAVRRVGGVTGDVLGAAGLLGESAGLLVAAVRW